MSAVSHSAQASGPGAIAVGGDAINSIFVTGGVNQFFVGQYERLGDAYLRPDPLYRELDLDDFSGRGWLVRVLDDFVSSNDRGYFVIEADAGMGKTAFLAWVARQRSYIHHFVRLMPDPDDIECALRNLASQIIRAWDLQTFAAGGVLPPTASRPDFFQELIFEAAQKRDTLKPAEPIVIAIDGLSETTARPGQNPFALPAELPKGMYIVATQRSVQVALVVSTPRRIIELEAESQENRDDIRSYLARAAAKDDLRKRLDEAGMAPQAFIERLAAWCRGRWLVLRYVLIDLRNGTRRLDDVDSLPDGLWHYYAQFWLEWERAHEDHWAMDLRLLATIAAVQEALPLLVLCELSGFVDVDRAGRLVADEWRPFLEVHEADDPRYRAFHDTLREFVSGRADLTDLGGADRALVARLAEAQRAAHGRIAHQYIEKWGGVGPGLPRIDGDGASIDDGYGLRHVVQHLASAGDDPVLHALMGLERPRVANATSATSTGSVNTWYEVHRARRAFAGYALDVQRAWTRAEEPSAGADGRASALEFRYALIATSVNSVAGNVPGDLLRLLIEEKEIAPAQGLDLAREIGDPRARTEALAALMPYLSGDALAQTLREALASVQSVPDGYWRAGELTRLVALVDDEHVDDLATLADALGESYYREIVHRAIARRQRGQATEPPVKPAASSVDPADPDVFAEQYLGRTTQAVATLLAGRGLRHDDGLDLVEVLEVTRFVRDPRWRAEMLTALAAADPTAVRRDLLAAALDIALTIGDRDAMVCSVRSTATELARLGGVEEALACLLMLEGAELQASALCSVAAASPSEQRSGMIGLAVQAIEQVADSSARGRLLRNHAVLLRASSDPEDFDRMFESIENEWRASVLVVLANEANIDQRDEMLVEALGIAEAVGDVAERSRLLTELVPILTLDLLGRARSAVEAFDDPEHLGRALSALAVRYAQFGQPGSARETISGVTDPYWRMEAEFGAACELAAVGKLRDAALFAANVWALPWRAEALAKSGQIDVADAVRDESSRIAVLLRIASPREAAAALADVHDPDLRFRFIVAIAVAMAERGDSVAALNLVAELRNDGDRAAALLGLSSHVGPASLDLALRMTRELSGLECRARMLARLTEPLVAAGASGLREHVREVLHLLAMGTRADLLTALPDLLPGVVELYGQQGLVDVADAISAVYRWWP
jgi:hypothetical protein